MKKYFLLALVVNCLFEIGVQVESLVSSTGRLYQFICGMTFAVNPFGWLLAGLKWPGSMSDVLLTHTVIIGLSVACICVAGFLRERSEKIFRISGTLMLSVYVLLGLFSFVISVL